MSQSALKDLRGRSLTKDSDLTAFEYMALVALANELRQAKLSGGEEKKLGGKNIALIFEKTSTRTRSAFEVAAHDQGAHVTYVGPDDSQLGRKETIKDTARVLGRMFDGIEFRGFAQRDIETLAKYAGVPVWNGLTDEWHPTQLLADVMTICNNSDKPFEEIALCYVGDARNNTANSLLVVGALLGLDVRISAPRQLQPSQVVRDIAYHFAHQSEARITITDEVNMAASGADFLYTDVWLSMGEPADSWGERIELLTPYQINRDLVAATGNDHVKVLHCLPAMHNADTQIGVTLQANYGITALEISEDVFESPASLVFEQAENRLHTIKALMFATLGGMTF
jgi:ornithine carbamoyltransferase